MAIWGLRWGDPWGRTADHDSPLLTITGCAPEPAMGPGAYRVTWTWSGGSRWGYRWGRRWGRAPVWFKLYVNGQLRVTTRETSARFTLTGAEDPRVQLVVVGPLNGDADYDPSIALEALDGNRVQLTWTAPADSDFERSRVYWDSGTGTVSYTTALAEVLSDPSASCTWVSEPLTDGTYKFVVRAVDEAGNEDTNTTSVSVVIATWPEAPSALAYDYDEDTDKVTLTWSGGATVNVYSNGGSGDIDYTTPEASSQTSPWTSAALTGPGTFRYAVRAVSGAREEKNLSYIEFELDAAADEVLRPGEPYGLRVTPAAGGTFTVEGFYDPRRPTVNGRQAAAISTLEIYHDNGTGTMDWNSAIGTATLSAAVGAYVFSYTTGAYAHGTSVKFGARAVSASATAGSNTDTETGVADANAPAAPTSLAGTAVLETESG